MSAGGDVQQLKVFISYSRKDSAFAEDLLLALETAGFDPFLDKHDIVPGEPWEERLDRLIQSADTVVFVISPDSLASKRVEWEIKRTEDLGKRIIPVVWREVPESETPTRLKRLNYVYFSGDGHSFARGLSGLAKALNTDLDWIREHTAYAEQAMRWLGKGRAEALLMRGDEIAQAKTWAARQPKDAPEPTLLQREFIAESEKAEQARFAFEKAQAEAMKNAELDKVRAEQESDKLRLEVLERQRRQSRLMLAGIVGLSLLGGVLGFREYQNSENRRIAAEELNKREQQIKEMQSRIAAITQAANVSIDQRSLSEVARQPQPPTPGRTQPLTPDQVDRLISQDAVNLIFAFEVGSQSMYERRYRKPVWPGGDSGAVIGIGFDLGYHTAEEIRKTWGPHLDAEVVEKLVSVAGIRGEAAKEALSSIADVDIPWSAAVVVFKETTLAKFGGLVIAAFPNAEELPPDSFGALVSLVYNRGIGMDGDRKTEMRAIRDLMAARAFDKVPEQIRAMKRLWPASMTGLLKRRDAEAALFEKGLLEAANAQAQKVRTKS